MPTILRLEALGLCVGLAMTAGAASAQTFGGGSWYVKGFGGATWPQDGGSKLRDNGVSLGNVNVSYDTGYVLGAAVGYGFTPNLAGEFEYAYRSADLTARRQDGTGDSNAIMLNLIYSFDGMGANGAWQPYLGAGVGAADLHVEIDDADFSQSNSWAYQLIGGVAYDVTPNWSLLGEARYYSVAGGSLEGPGRLRLNTSFDSFDLLVGASYHF